MAKGVMFSPGAATRIKASVRKTEGAVRTQSETQRGQILNKGNDSTVNVLFDDDFDPYAPIQYFGVTSSSDGVVARASAYDTYSGLSYKLDPWCYPICIVPASGAEAGQTIACGIGYIPVRARVASFATWIASSVSLDTRIQWGFVSNMDGMAPGLPGFIYLGDYNESTQTAIFAVANNPLFTGKVYSVSADSLSVVIQPRYSGSGFYDGSGAYPDVRITTYMHGHAMTAVACSYNIAEGDIVLASPMGMWQNAVVVTNCSDSPVGTVRLVTSTATIPRGWAEMNGTSNSSGNGGSGIDMTDKFVRGGSGSGSIFNGELTQYDWYGLRFIERLAKNV